MKKILNQKVLPNLKFCNSKRPKFNFWRSLIRLSWLLKQIISTLKKKKRVRQVYFAPSVNSFVTILLGLLQNYYASNKLSLRLAQNILVSCVIFSRGFYSSNKLSLRLSYTYFFLYTWVRKSDSLKKNRFFNFLYRLKLTGRFSPKFIDLYKNHFYFIMLWISPNQIIT